MVQSQIGLEETAAQLRREIFAYIRGKVGDSSTADDLTQETFLRVEKALARGTEPEHFSWLDFSDRQKFGCGLGERKATLCRSRGGRANS